MSMGNQRGDIRVSKKFGKYSVTFTVLTVNCFFPLGIGTYKAEPYKEDNYIINFAEAIKTALRNGINLVDTAINYRYQIKVNARSVKR